jgi:ClpP class serine protease
MDENAVLGPVDPQLGEYPAVSILKVVEEKTRDEIDDKTLIMADIARKAMRQINDFVFNLLKDNVGEEKAGKIAEALTQGRWTHDYPITCSELRELGLQVRTGLQREIYSLMELYPQPAQRRPSVQYIPAPYFTDDKEKK